MNRRQFIKRGAIYLPAFSIFVPSAKAISTFGGKATLAGKVGLSQAAAAGGPAITFVKSNSNVSAPTSATSTVQLTTVTAGNLIIVAQKSEGAGEQAISGISDGTSSFSLATEKEHTNGDLRWRFGYLLSSVASGTVTYTVTRGNALACCFTTFAFEFSYSGGTAAFDTEPTGGGASGNSNAPNSGNMTTGASKCVVLGGYGHYAAVTPSAFQLGGTNADGTEPVSPGSGQSVMWYRILSSVMTNGAATCTLTPGENWVCNAMSIKVT